MLRATPLANKPMSPELVAEREHFRASQPPGFTEQWQKYPGRIGVVLSGGGARGAYEAGVLLAFQDAKLPTHIIAATSIGSINASSYAAHSDSLVGNAESLVESWSDLSPPAVGIDWFRYVFILAGLVAATAGVGNLIRQAMSEQGIFVHLTQPKLTWLALAVTGIAILFFYDELPYLGYVLKSKFRKRNWNPDRPKLMKSVFANVLAWGGVVFFLAVAHIHFEAGEFFEADVQLTLFLAAAGVLFAALGYTLRKPISMLSHKFLRLPLRTGLFPNYERTRFLKERIGAHKLRNSPIRVAMTAADVSAGTERCFTNAEHSELLRDPGVSAEFVLNETQPAQDMLMVVIASSAFPIVYETVPMDGHLWTDGGIVSNQPIRPAIRLGADVLFLVLNEPRSQQRSEIKTFLDLGVRSIDILMNQNLKTDLKILSSVNAICEHYATALGLRAEQVEVAVGKKQYRFLKAITVAPDFPLPATVLDFDGHITAPAILQGYRDGQKAVLTFAEYIRELPSDLHKREVKLVAEELSARATHA